MHNTKNNISRRMQPPDIFTKVFDDGARHSLPARLRQIEAKYAESAQYGTDLHSLVGLCATFGLREILDEVEAFKAAPSEASIATLWATMHATKQQLQSARDSPVASGGSRSRAPSLDRESELSCDTVNTPTLGSTRQSPQPYLSQLGSPEAGVSRLFRLPGPSPLLETRAPRNAISPFFVTR